MCSSSGRGQLGAVFGVGLKELYERSGSEVPHVFADILRWLAAHGLNQPDVFAQPSRTTEVARLCRLYDNMDNSDAGCSPLPADVEPAAVGSLLKRWLEALPEPLLSWEQQVDMLTACTSSDISLRVEDLRQATLLVDHVTSLGSLKPLLLFLQQYCFRQLRFDQQLLQVACAFAPVLFPAALSAGPDELRLAEETCATLISNALHIFNPAVAADVPVVTPQVLSVAAAVAAAAGQQQQQQAPALAQGQDVAQQEQQEEEEEEAYMQDGLFLLSVDVMVHDCVTYGLFGDSDDYYDGGDEYTNSGGGLVGYSSTGLRAEAEEVDVELGLGLALPVGRARAPAAAWAEPEHVQLPSTPAKPAHAPAAVPAAAQAGTKQPLGSHNGAGSALGADASAFVAAKARIHQKLGLDGSSHFCLISASPAASPCSSPGPGVAPGAHRGQQQQQQPHGKAAGWSAFAAPPPSSPWPCGAGAAFCGGDGEVLDMLQEQAALAEALSGGQGPLLGMTSTWPAVRRPSEGGAAAWAAVSPSGSLITAGSQPLALMMTRRGTMGSSSGGAGSPHTPAGLPASPRPGSNATLPLQQPQRRQTLGGSGEGSSSGGGSVASSPRAVAAAAVRPRGSDSDGGGRPPLAAAGSASLDVEPLGLVGITSVGLLLCRDEHGRLAPPQLLVRELPSSGSGAASQQQQQQLPVPVRELGLAAVAAEKEQLKRQLKEVAAAFERCTGRPMSPAEKEPLRPLYVRYHKLKAALLKAAAAPIAAHYHAHGGGHHLSSSNGSSASLRPVAV